jgi:hypothetical protein
VIPSPMLLPVCGVVELRLHQLQCRNTARNTPAISKATYKDTNNSHGSLETAQQFKQIRYGK